MSALYCVVRVSDGEVVGVSTRFFMRALEDIEITTENWRVAHAIQPLRDCCISHMFDQPIAPLENYEANGYRLERREVCK